MRDFWTIFVLSVLTSVDNAVIVSGIARRSRYNLVLVGLLAALILSALRTPMVLGVVSVRHLTGLRLCLGIAVLWVAVRLCRVEPDARDEMSFGRLLTVIVVTDLALSLDTVLGLAVVARNPLLVWLGVACSLLPLYALLPVFAEVMERVWWMQILTAGFVAELGIDSITDDPLLPLHLSGRPEILVRAAAAAVTIAYGFWRAGRR